MDEALQQAARLFNEGRFSEFQDALEAMTSHTRAASERQLYSVLDNLAEALLQFSDGDLADAEELISAGLRRLEEFLPRFRGIDVLALRDDFQRVIVELREARAGRRQEHAPSRLPRLRLLA